MELKGKIKTSGSILMLIGIGLVVYTAHLKQVGWWHIGRATHLESRGRKFNFLA